MIVLRFLGGCLIRCCCFIDREKKDIFGGGGEGGEGESKFKPKFVLLSRNGDVVDISTVDFTEFFF